MRFGIDAPRRALNDFLWRFRFETWVIEGEGRAGGGALRLSYAGMEPYKNYFVRAAFADGYSERALGRAWPWDAARKLRAQAADLEVYEVSAIKAPFFRGAGALFRIPVWMRSEVDLARLQHYERASIRYKNVRRRLKKNGLVREIARDQASFDEFYHRMYVPYIRSRHESAALVHAYADLHRKFFARDQELLFVVRDGVRIAAAIVEYRGDEGHGVYMGVLDADPEYLKMGVSEAIYVFEFERFKERGKRVANLGHSRGFLTDGPLQYKSTFGGRFSGRHHEESGCLSMRINAPTPAVRAFLAANPFVTMEGRGDYRAVVFAADETLAAAPLEALNGYPRQGLSGVRLYAFDGSRPGKIKFVSSAPLGDEVMP